MKKCSKSHTCDSDTWIKCLSLVYTDNLRQYRLFYRLTFHRRYMLNAMHAADLHNLKIGSLLFREVFNSDRDREKTRFELIRILH